MLPKWVENRDKNIKILREIRKASGKFAKILSMNEVKEIISRFFDMELYDKKVRSRFSTAAYPIEEIRVYKVYSALPSYSKAIELLSSNKFSVGSVDSSSHDLGAHAYIPFRIHNVGSWYMNYDDFSGAEDNTVFIGEPHDYYDIGERVWMKRNEAQVIQALINRLVGEKRYLMLDESFNIGFTMSWSIDERKLYAESLKAYIDDALDNNVVPLGIFYTKSVDIMRGMIDTEVLKEGEYPWIPDKFLMNSVLDVGDRSPLFRVYSEPHIETGLEINMFYLKTGEKNILRIEFPSGVDNIIDIHKVVLLTSILGGGYPYPLFGSHQNAVLTWDLREAINEVISEVAGIPIEAFYSRKEEGKRWPIA
jgi:hypothetical protein